MLTETISQLMSEWFLWIKIHLILGGVGWSIADILSATGGFLDIIKGKGAIVYNRVHVLDESTSLSRTREKENKIRHRLANVKAVRTA